MMYEMYGGLVKEMLERLNYRFQVLFEKVEERFGGFEEMVVEVIKIVLKVKECVGEMKKEKEEMEKGKEEMEKKFEG